MNFKDRTATEVTLHFPKLFPWLLQMEQIHRKEFCLFYSNPLCLFKVTQRWHWMWCEGE